MKTKVAIIIERANIVLGGAERSAFELSTSLAAAGFEVDVLAAKGQTSSKNIHLLCQDVSGGRVSFAVFEKALKKHLKENHYDIVHSFLPLDFADIYQPRGGSYAEAVTRNAASYQNGLVESYKRVTSFANLRRTRLFKAEKKLCRQADGPMIVALSEYVKEQFQKHYDVADERIIVIANGVNTKKQVDHSESDKLCSQIMIQLGLKEADEPMFLLFAAHNFRLKGLSCLIEAMHLAQQSSTSSNVYLIVAGNAKTKKYRHLAKKLGVEKRIIFLGAVRHIQNALSISDVAVLPTFYDPSSRYILEALAVEKPVITTKFNGATDLFEDNRHGIVIETPEDIEALAEAINFFSNADNIQRASEAIAEDNLKDKVSVTRVVREFKALYELVLERRGQE